MNTSNQQHLYKAFYNGKKEELKASSSFEAHRKACNLFHVKQANKHMVSVILLVANCDSPEAREVTHSTAQF